MQGDSDEEAAQAPGRHRRAHRWHSDGFGALGDRRRPRPASHHVGCGDGCVAQFDGSKPVRRGPAEVCENLGNRSGTFYIWCSKFNYLGHLWHYGRDSSSNVVGWVYHGNFSSISGSNGAKC